MMEHAHHWAPGYDKPVSRCLCLPLGVGVLVVGVVGVCVGVATLAAYSVCQVPTIRAAFGGYFWNTTQENIDDFQLIEYKIEIIVCVISGILGILVNALLVYGVLSSKRWFLIHWLVLHVLVLASSLIAAILVAILQPRIYKLFCLFPFSVVFLIIYCWIKVYQLFGEIGAEYRPRKPCKVHPNGPNTYLSSHWSKFDDYNDGNLNIWAPPQFQDNLEFYPIDSVSRKMQERLIERPFGRRHWSIDLDRYRYHEQSEDTESSIVPNMEEKDKAALSRKYAPLPSHTSRQSNVQDFSDSGHVNEGYETEGEEDEESVAKGNIYKSHQKTKEGIVSPQFLEPHYLLHHKEPNHHHHNHHHHHHNHNHPHHHHRCHNHTVLPHQLMPAAPHQDQEVQYQSTSQASRTDSDITQIEI